MKEIWYEPKPPRVFRYGYKSNRQWEDYQKYTPREFVLTADLCDERLDEGEGKECWECGDDSDCHHCTRYGDSE